jgi:hypothetical protein
MNKEIYYIKSDSMDHRRYFDRLREELRYKKDKSRSSWLFFP